MSHWPESSRFWQDKRVLVTGGAGFLGSFVVEKLKARGCREIFVPRSREYNLVQMEAVQRVYRDARPELVIHLAARVGGIGANRAGPGRFFYDNLMMGVQMMEVGRQVGIEKFVTVATICSYPKYTRVPFREEDLWNGYPEETNAPYGLAKKMLLVQSQAYRQQYGFNGICVIPTNLYGPGDSFDLETSHVIPAMIRKCEDAKEAGRDEVVLWGTGTASREFLYVDDAAEAIVAALERYDGPEPLNLGAGAEITIRELAGLVAQVTGFAGKFVWDPSYPDGQRRRSVDGTKARQLLGWEPKVNLAEGLAETEAWFRAQRAPSRDARAERRWS